MLEKGEGEESGGVEAALPGAHTAQADHLFCVSTITALAKPAGSAHPCTHTDTPPSRALTVRAREVDLKGVDANLLAASDDLLPRVAVFLRR